MTPFSYCGIVQCLKSGLRLLSLLALLCSPLAASAANLTDLSVSPQSPMLGLGETLQLTATGSYGDGTQRVIEQAKQVSAGGGHTCAVSTDGTVQCWGINRYGQLGNGTTTASSVPITVSGINNAVAFSAGDAFTCAVIADGTVQCWGRNRYGQLGNGTTTDSLVPITVSGISNAVAVSAGGGLHACAVIADGTVQCWGYNFYGQLGNGTTTASLVPITVSGISNAVAVSAGDGGTCALLADSTLRCWGNNSAGQLGDGTLINPLIPVTVNGISTALAVGVGWSHACAQLADGTLRCWGTNTNGELGNGTKINSSIPVAVSGISAAVAVSVGSSHSCAVLADRTVQCWGDNYDGQLGIGTTSDSSIPVTVNGIGNAVAVSAGSYHTCAVIADGALRCWGANGAGQIGNGFFGTQSSPPVAVSNINTAVAVSAGGVHACAVVANGTVQCWGGNSFGQLGSGSANSSAFSATPVTVGGDIRTAVEVSAGHEYTCARLADGTLRCWGANSLGQLGNFFTYSVTPGVVTGISTAVAISAGYQHTCALLADRTVSCWGRNTGGQLGIGTIDIPPLPHHTPTAVIGISTAVAISAGSYHTCAVLAAGTVQCWGGNNYGQLGNGTTTDSLIPVTVSGISNAVAVSAGSIQTCAVLADRTVRCWGAGALGNGTTTSSTIPVAVSGISTAVAVGAKEDYTCVVLADGTVQCWGSGPGLTSSIKSTTPVAVNGITAVKVSTGASHICAQLADGTLRCWGDNSDGQLGNGKGSRYSSPEPTLGYYPLDWNSSDPSTVAVDAAGNVSAVGSGTAVITATTGSISASTTVTVVKQTDLAINMSAPISVLQGQPVTYTVSATNNGPSPATGVAVTGTLPTCTIGSLASGATGSCASTVTATTVGTLTQTMSVSGGEVDSHPANNSKSVSTTVDASAAADLVPTALTASLFGTSLVIKDSVKNQGIASAKAFNISYYLSTDAAYDAGDTYACKRSVTRLAAGASDPSKGIATTDCALPPAVTAGAYYVLAVDDSDKVIAENDESNNIRATLSSVTIGPDLVATSLSAKKANSKVTVRDTVKNGGNLNVSSAFSVSYYLSNDSNYQAGDIALASDSNGSGTCTRNISALKAGSGNSGGATCYKPATAKNGVNYYVLAVDDEGNVIAETNEDNNTKATRRTIRW